MVPSPTTGLGVPVLAIARIAPLMTLVVAVCVLLAVLTSLSAVSTAVAAIVAGPGPSARQRSVMSRTSSPPAPTVPRLHSTTVADKGTQLALDGDDNK